MCTPRPARSRRSAASIRYGDRRDRGTSRILVGAEIGHYWIFDRKILDLSAYGKFVDNFAQNFSSSPSASGPQSIAVQGIGESQYGADAGASASLSLTHASYQYDGYRAASNYIKLVTASFDARDCSRAYSGLKRASVHRASKWYARTCEDAY